MKKILLFLVIAVLVTSCYDEYRLDYPYSTVAFTNADGGSDQPGVLWRTVVMGEGLKFDAGIYLAGVIENKEERWADFTIDASLLTGTGYTLMPSNYYELSNNSRFVIPAGSHIGKVTVNLDSALFIGDANTVNPHYAIPIRLTATSEDSILSTRSTQILVIRYINYYEGSYNHKGTFTTYDANDDVINEGTISNVLRATTTLHNSVRTNGLIYSTGVDFQMDISANSPVSVSYYPNPDPVLPANLAMGSMVSTSYVSPWESIAGINLDREPTASNVRTNPIYGNWPSAGLWRWVQYDLGGVFIVDKSEMFWFTDGGGLLIPTESYIEYWDLGAEAWVEVPSPDNYGHEADQFNVTNFNPVLTDKIRYHFVNATQSTGIITWRVWGVPGAIGYEMAEISSIVNIGTDNRYDTEKNAFVLKYRVNFAAPNTHYTIVETEMAWRNRIRDGVNEWRR